MTVTSIDTGTPTLLCEIEERVATITLNRPEARNALTWEQKFELDLWYVDRVAPGLDLKIMCKTLGQVLSRRGVSASGEATMPEFFGTTDKGRQS